MRAASSELNFVEPFGHWLLLHVQQLVRQPLISTNCFTELCYYCGPFETPLVQRSEFVLTMVLIDAAHTLLPPCPPSTSHTVTIVFPWQHDPTNASECVFGRHSQVKPSVQVGLLLDRRTRTKGPSEAYTFPPPVLPHPLSEVKHCHHPTPHLQQEKLTTG